MYGVEEYDVLLRIARALENSGTSDNDFPEIIKNNGHKIDSIYLKSGCVIKFDKYLGGYSVLQIKEAEKSRTLFIRTSEIEFIKLKE